MYRYKHEFALSWEDLEEAREVAYYGGMKLHLADYYLEACGNVKEVLWARDEGLGEDSGKGCFIIEEGELVELIGVFLGEADRLIRETGYYRRDGELGELKAWGAKG